MNEKEDLMKQKKDLQNEIQFMISEQNQKELECCEIKDKLRKREEEIQDIKMSLNNQIAQIYEQY